MVQRRILVPLTNSLLISILDIPYLRSYLGATEVYDASSRCRTRIDTYNEQVRNNTLPVDGEQIFEADIIEILRDLFDKCKYLRERVSQISQQTPDRHQIEVFGNLFLQPMIHLYPLK